MNKHCFRLIFSAVVGCLIPVAEITRAQRKPGQQPSAPSVEISSPSPGFSLNTLFLSLLLACLPGWAAADILVDPNRSSGTTVVSAPNGMPVIEIANPNGNGLSHNRFTEFDVQKPGAIFNNSLVNGQSQLGGAVLLNPNLQREATAILTEVTGNGPSSINGTLEVFGGKADLLIAKPVLAGQELLLHYGPQYNRSGWADHPVEVSDTDSSDGNGREPDEAHRPLSRPVKRTADMAMDTDSEPLSKRPRTQAARKLLDSPPAPAPERAPAGAADFIDPNAPPLLRLDPDED